jgi:hypothetical protein
MDNRHPQIEQPFGCVAEFSLELGDKERSGGFRGYEVKATMACPGLNGSRTLVSDRILAPHVWSERNVPARAAEIAKRAAVEAVSMCATCSISGCGDTLGRQISLAQIQHETAEFELQRAQLGQPPIAE